MFALDVSRAALLGHRRRLIRVGSRCTLGVFVAVIALAKVGVAVADPSLKWSAPVLVDRAVPSGVRPAAITALSCPSVKLCVGFDDIGHLIMSADPARPRSWRTTAIPGTVAPQSMSCASESLCLAVDYAGSGPATRILISTAPRTGARSWHAERVGVEKFANKIACPSTTLCVVTENNGNLLTSTDPTGGAGTWQEAHVDGAQSIYGGVADLEGVACPSVSVCVAVDDGGNVLTSTDPAGGSSAWKLAHVVNPNGRDAIGNASVSCPSASACAAVEDATILTSDNPTGGSAAWMVSSVQATEVAPISCPSVSFCVAAHGYGAGAVISSDAPVGAAQRWRASHIDGTNDIYVTSCPSTTLCILGDSEGNVLVGSTPRLRIREPTLRGFGNSATVVARGTAVLVDSGLTVDCPAHGPACTVTAIAADTSGPRNVLLGRGRLTIAAGTQTNILFTLSSRGVQQLKKHHGVGGGVLTVIARDGRGPAFANESDYVIPPTPP